MSKETFTFQTEVSRLLDIVASSLYSNREIFLRELISNASDACDKLRHQALTSPSLIEGDHDFKVALSVDKEAKTITVSDNGIGMNHDDLLATLGTIASSGTGAFIEQMSKDDKKDSGLIGQFGVGFYSAFMVCDKVEVTARKAGEQEGWLWVSDGKGEFSIEKGSRDERGTTVVLYLKKDAEEFLEPSRITHIVKMYSDHIGFPVTLAGQGDGEDGKEGKEETLNAASAIWTRSPQEVDAEQYKEFYHHTAHAFDEPWITLHNRIEGVVSYTNLLFIPSVRPFDLFDPDRKSHVKLFVNRVFITEQADGLLPPYLRFLRGVVDSEDLSLNISREMLQTDPKLNKIRNGLVKKVLGALKKKADNDAEAYAQFWDNFGIVLKEGLVDDYPMRDKLLELTRFKSTAETMTSLAGYVERMKEGQEAIYYITGEDEAQLASSPHLEGFKAKGIEVLLLIDPVDEFWMQHITDFDGKALKSITRGEANLDAIKTEDDDNAKDDKAEDAPQLDLLIAAIKLELGESVKDVRPSKRLTESPVCLIADDGDMDVNMERLLRRHGQMTNGMPRVLELNPSHAIVKKLAERAGDDAEDALLKDAAHLLLDQARIAEGEAPTDAAAFAKRLASVMERAL
ncbi:MAG: molecular chaperone HtpG [Magnetovibrio sp.]|nr:molecular chaperone HtpG [Magnetovibrio sp.]